MKRKVLFFNLFFAFSMAGAVAQIVVQRSDLPVIGHQTVNGYDETTIFEIGNAGPNQTWDFSNAVATSHDTSVYILPQQAPNWQLYPGANMAAYSTSAEGGAYGFYEDNGNDIGIRGFDIQMSVMPGFDYVMHMFYQQPQWMFLPYHYGDNHSYSITEIGYAGTYISGTLSDSTKSVSHVNGTLTVDAWGTMITPIGSYPVLRLKETQNFVDSLYTWVDNSWVFQSTSPGANESYSWMSNQHGFIGELYVTDARASGFSFFVSQTVVNTNNISLPEHLITVSPNPATDFIIINAPGKIEKVAVYNMDGQLQITSTNQKSINVTNLKAGIYIARILSVNETAVVKFVKN